MSFLIDKECPKYIVILATLNFVLALFGYELIATLGSPFMSLGHTQFITIPYRAVCLGLSLFLIMRCRPVNFHFKSIIICLIIYWSILIIRLVNDFYIQWDFDISPEGKKYVLLFFLGINFTQTMAYALSCDKVDYTKAFRYLAIILITIAIFNIIFNPILLFGGTAHSDLVTTDGRITGGAALNTISFAHCGVALSLISLYIYYYVENINKKIALLFFCLGALIVLKAGSRGPFICLVVILFLFYSFKTKQIIYAFLIGALFIVLIYAFKDFLLDFVKDVSPVLYNRTMATIEKGDFNGRNHFFEDALIIWQQNPLFGKYFTLYFGSPAKPGYTHNLFFDSMIMGGLVGVVLMTFFFYYVIKALYLSLKYSSIFIWITLIIFHQYLGCLSSGCFWGTPSLSIGLLAISLLMPYISENNIET